jgi:hypothetical protein
MIEMDHLLPLDVDDTGSMMPVFVGDAPFEMSGLEHRFVVIDYTVSRL